MILTVLTVLTLVTFGVAGFLHAWLRQGHIQEHRHAHVAFIASLVTWLFFCLMIATVLFGVVALLQLIF